MTDYYLEGCGWGVGGEGVGCERETIRFVYLSRNTLPSREKYTQIGWVQLFLNFPITTRFSSLATKAAKFIIYFQHGF